MQSQSMVLFAGALLLPRKNCVGCRQVHLASALRRACGGWNSFKIDWAALLRSSPAGPRSLRWACIGARQCTPTSSVEAAML
mmetsp:Transcript_11663/g.22690  ORF Transcript_11663/g.22690 Transcript_11663/m.22690 type:complete len:82 (+) Transcript_11663:227-472(+)